MNFKNDSIPPTFAAYCKQAKLMTSVGTYSSSSNLIQAGNCKSYVAKLDVLNCEDKDIIGLSTTFSGLDLTVLDPPKVKYGFKYPVGTNTGLEWIGGMAYWVQVHFSLHYIHL